MMMTNGRRKELQGLVRKSREQEKGRREGREKVWLIFEPLICFIASFSGKNSL